MNQDGSSFSIEGVERLAPEAQAIAIQEVAAVVKVHKRSEMVIYSVGWIAFFAFLSTCAVVCWG